MGNNRKKKLNDATKDLVAKIKGGGLIDDVSLVHDVVKDDDEAEISPEVKDEQAFGGDTAELTSDDDIDQVGEEYGVSYKDEEELDVSKKINIQTQLEPSE